MVRVMQSSSSHDEYVTPVVSRLGSIEDLTMGVIGADSDALLLGSQ